ncbi:methyl-accepting chemotaxis protein [Siccibacter turicensis]|uniref:methyl-accepting chemotaxis protein n=1 Tax=Siccibacter turicensis TaxID=357233 RepID=UPI002A6A3DF1|nr:methyl-accepting chemotaxis protein [Siccibacter turicensis]MDY0971463.1 methyl-accepting chemotaxis protein [Siccibacter turicensis]
MSTMTFPHTASHSGLITLAQIRLRADGLMLSLAWLLWLIALGVGWHHDAIALALVVGGALTVAATGVKLLFAGRLLSRLWFAFTLMAFAALLIQLGHGETEYHFSVFVLLSALLAWRDWRPLLMAAATAAVHHALFNYLQERDLFGIVCFMHPGFHMVVFHALFVVAQTAVLTVMAVRMAQDARSASEVARLASVINREPGRLTLAVNDAARYSPFARTFSTTLDTMRDTLTRVSAGINALLAASGTLIERNAGLSARTDEQARDLAVATRGMAQITEAAALNSEKAQAARQLATQASDVAQQGGAHIDAATGCMAQIRDDSQRINGILELIDGIAFQTNILSLNASVEAARAGEHGKGFAVVASEVRTLAQRCELAAKEIRELIAVSVARTNDGAERVEQAGATMREMIHSIDSLRLFIDDLSRMSDLQRSSIGEVRNSIASIDESVQQNARHVAQTLSVAEDQQQQTRSLQEAIALFRFA